MAEVKYLDKTGLTSVWSKVKGIVTPKADKVSGATAGHLAGLNSSGNLTDSGLAATNVAQKDGSYSGMTVGAAEDLVSAESVASEFTSRITGGSTAVGKGGTALVDKIKGRTLVWNQLVKQSYGSTVTPNEVTITIASDGKFTLSGTASASGGRTSYVSSTTNRIPIISGHKYISVNGAPSTLSPYVTLPSSTSTLLQTPNGIITTASTTFEGRLGFDFTKDINYDGVSFYLSLFDLTLMFGAGNEPATAEEFEALYPGPYYDYNAGELINNAAAGVETVGFNQWDEEWEAGMVSPTDGTNVSSNTQIRSSYIPVIGGADYFFPTKTYIVCIYDANKKFLSRIKYSTAGVTRTLDNNAAYLRFCTYTDYGVTYKNDICISISDPSRNGTYEPYWRSELELNIPTLTGKLNGTGNSVVIFPDGLRSAGTVYDEIVGNKAIKRIGNRAYTSGDEEDATLITDSTTTYYPLATPQEYILDEAIPTAMRNDPYGTERRLPEDTAAIVTAPFRADITYSTNIKEAVQSMHQNFINVNSMQDFLAALGTLMGGTWTMRQADGKFDFTFTPNPSNE